MRIGFSNGDALHLHNFRTIVQDRPTQTYLFLICIQKRYVDGFLNNGTIKFSKISDWQPDGTSRGDNMECVFASTRETNPKAIELISRLRQKTTLIKEKNIIYFRSKTALEMRALCLFGLSEKIMHLSKTISQDHRFHQRGVVPKEYFHNLFPNWDKAKYESVKGEDKPYLLIIRPDQFYTRLISALKSKGIRDDEIMAAPISYFNMQEESFILGHEWDEVFCKDKKYSEQNEVRIVINTKREEVKKELDKTDGIIEIGPLYDIANASPFYFEDMQCEIRDNKLLYSLSVPEESFLTLQDWIIIITQTLSDELPSSPATITTLDKMLRECTESMNSKYPMASFNNITKNIEVINEEGVTETILCSNKAQEALKRHYHDYIQRGDYSGAQNTKEIFIHFFGCWDNCE